ncbi:MAG TPA: glycosyltransferase family 87 protein [Candidatus Binataceae bacterium]
MESTPQGNPPVAAPDRSRRLELLSVLALSIGAVILVRTLHQNRLRYKEEAFCDYYVWSLELRLGGDPWLPASDVSFRARPGIPHRGVCNYPPVFLLAFEPFTKLSRPAAFWILQAILVASMLGATILITHETGPPGSATPYLAAIAAVLLFPETYGALYESEPTFLLLAVLMGALALDRRGHSTAAGFALALATLLKFYPGLIGCYFLLRRRWATVAWSFGFAFAGLIVGGLRHHYEMMRFGVPITNQWWIQDRAIGILQSMRSMVAAVAGNQFSARMMLAWLSSSALLYALVGAAAVDATIRSAERDDLDLISFGLWIAAALLYSPLAWAHELPLMIPLWIGAAACIARGAARRNVGTILLMLGLAGTIAPYFTGPLRRTHMFFAAAILAYAGAWWLVRTWNAETIPSAESRGRDQTQAGLAPMAAMKRS